MRDRETKAEKTERYHKQTEQLLMGSAEWIDSFFGSEIYTAEVNKTYLRFRWTSFVEDGQVYKYDITCRLIDANAVL